MSGTSPLLPKVIRGADHDEAGGNFSEQQIVREPKCEACFACAWSRHGQEVGPAFQRHLLEGALLPSAPRNIPGLKWRRHGKCEGSWRLKKVRIIERQA